MLMPTPRSNGYPANGRSRNSAANPISIPADARGLPRYGADDRISARQIQHAPTPKDAGPAESTSNNR